MNISGRKKPTLKRLLITIPITLFVSILGACSGGDQSPSGQQYTLEPEAATAHQSEDFGEISRHHESEHGSSAPTHSSKDSSDGTPPTLTVDMPVSNSAVAGGSVVSGTATDELSGVASVEVIIRNQSTHLHLQPDGTLGPWNILSANLTNPGTTSTAWTYVATSLPPAPYYVLSRATDANGNTTAWNRTDIVVIAGNPADNTSGSSNNNGNNTDQATGTDSSSDSVPPALTVDMPVSNSTVAGGSVVSGTATDELSGVASVEVIIRNQSTHLHLQPDGTLGPWNILSANLTNPGTTSTAWTYVATSLPPAPYYVLSRATDANGNTTAWNRTDIVVIAGNPADNTSGSSNNNGNNTDQATGTDSSSDSVPPALTVDMPVSNSTVAGGSVVSGTATDELSGVASVEVIIRNQSTHLHLQPDGTLGPWNILSANLTNPGTTSTAWTYVATSLPPAPYYVLSRATDANGNTTAWNRTDIVVIAGNPADNTSGSSNNNGNNTDQGTGSIQQPPQSNITPAISHNAKIALKFVPVFDAKFAESRAFLNSVAAAGHGQSIYDLQLAHNAFLNMFEATRNRKYLEQALTWMETQISKATVIDRHGMRNWAALGGRGDVNFASQPTSFFVEEAIGVSEMARLARIVLTDTELSASYGSRAQAIATFINQHIIEKWFITRVPDGGDYMGWLLNNANLNSNPGNISDKGLIYARILMDMYFVQANQQYADWFSSILTSFRQRLMSTSGPAGTLTFDQGRHDTAHANRHVYALMDAYEKGIVFSKSDVEGIANLFVSRIWNQSLQSPAFVNFMNGNNGSIYGRGPYGNAAIYFGWEKLGLINPTAQSAIEALFDSIVARRNNPSDAYNGSIYGILGLSAGLARNLALAPGQN